MTAELTRYLQDIRLHLRLEPAKERQILGELYLHLEEEVRTLMEQGRSQDEAVHETLEQFGRSEELGKQLYEAHHQGTWQEALLAAAPHLMLAFLFWSQDTLLFWSIAGFLAFSAGMTLWGWWKGKPVWLYPWVGYSLVPALVAGLLALAMVLQGGIAWFTSRPLPLKPWAYVGLLGAMGLLIGLFANVITRVARKDWALVSLMAMPFPVLAWWFLSAPDPGQALPHLSASFPDVRAGVVAALLALSCASALFILFRQRQAKIIALLLVTCLVSLLLWGSYSGVNILLAALLSLLSGILLLSPVLLERLLRKREDFTDPWWRLVSEAGPGER